MISLLPDEIMNHIFSYCQSSTNQIMKNHIDCLNEVYRDELYLYEILCYELDYDCKSNYLRNVLRLMAFYGHIHFDKIQFYSRYYSCVNCRRVGYAPPHIEFGEKFCNSYCADMFDY